MCFVIALLSFLRVSSSFVSRYDLVVGHEIV